MIDLDSILAGFEEELELERELGTRLVEIDRKLLPGQASVKAAGLTVKAPPVAPKSVQKAVGTQQVAEGARKTTSEGGIKYDFVFLHHAPLSAEGEEMMAKIVAFMGKTQESAPIVYEEPLPRAECYVALGARALAKFFPGRRGEPGGRFTDNGRQVEITYSPDHVLRFGTDLTIVGRMKKSMLATFKVVLQKVRM